MAEQAPLPASGNLADQATTPETTVVDTQPSPEPTTDPAKDEAKAAEGTTSENKPASPFEKLAEKLGGILKEADYNEVYGVTLGTSSHVPTQIILEKFLRANTNDVDKAAGQLLDTLKWRKEYRPLEARDEVFNKEKFGGLGYITVLDNVPEEAGKNVVTTWNIYGAVKDLKKTFGDIDR